MVGPCLCGDPYCPSCGNPYLAELEDACEWAVGELTGCSVEEIRMAIEVGLKAVEHARVLADTYAKNRVADALAARDHLEAES